MESLRGFVLFIYVIAFLLSLGTIASIPSAAWRYIADWQKISLGFGILVAFCGVLLAYFVWEDGRRIELLEEGHAHATTTHPEFCCGKCQFYWTKECERMERNFNAAPCSKFYSKKQMQ